MAVRRGLVFLRVNEKRPVPCSSKWYHRPLPNDYVKLLKNLHLQVHDESLTFKKCARSSIRAPPRVLPSYFEATSRGTWYDRATTPRARGVQRRPWPQPARARARETLGLREGPRRPSRGRGRGERARDRSLLKSARQLGLRNIVTGIADPPRCQQGRQCGACRCGNAGPKALRPEHGRGCRHRRRRGRRRPSVARFAHLVLCALRPAATRACPLRAHAAGA